MASQYHISVTRHYKTSIISSLLLSATELSSGAVAGLVSSCALVHVYEVNAPCFMCSPYKLQLNRYNFSFAYYLIYTGAVEPRFSRSNFDKTGKTGLNHSSTGTIRVQTGLNPLIPCQSVSPPVRNGLHCSSPWLNRPNTAGLHHARFITVQTGWRHGCSRNCRYHHSVAPFLTSFPVSPGCIKHFKTTGDMSWFNKVHPDVPRFSMVTPRL